MNSQNKDKKIIELHNLIESAEISLQQARQILSKIMDKESDRGLAAEAKKIGQISTDTEGQVIEGVFDGQNMVGPDEKKYSVPANYASKSKLVEGDRLKLTITTDGSFVYKQIQLLDRDRLIGKLSVDEKTNEYRVLANNKSYKVLTASITYYKGEVGDQVVILTPKGRETAWAAVENIYKPSEQIPPQKSELEKEEKKVAKVVNEESLTDKNNNEFLLKNEDNNEEKGEDNGQAGQAKEPQGAIPRDEEQIKEEQTKSAFLANEPGLNQATAKSEDFFGVGKETNRHQPDKQTDNNLNNADGPDLATENNKSAEFKDKIDEEDKQGLENF